jgi:hypothetical protein
MTVDDADLETNVLEFHAKSFSFDRLVDWDGEELALFHRTETESESRFRPKVLRLTVALPKSWLALEISQEMLLIARDGKVGAPRSIGNAVEAAAEATRFDEQGVTWRRHPVADGGFLYVPEDWAGRILTIAGLARLGFG